jgi:hypothetical protein
MTGTSSTAVAYDGLGWHRNEIQAIGVDRLLDGLADEPITNALVLVQDGSVVAVETAGQTAATGCGRMPRCSALGYGSADRDRVPGPLLRLLEVDHALAG